MDDIEPDFSKMERPEPNFRCPKLLCDGRVCFVDDEDEAFFGCGSCGEVFRARPWWTWAIKRHRRG